VYTFCATLCIMAFPVPCTHCSTPYLCRVASMCSKDVSRDSMPVSRSCRCSASCCTVALYSRVSSMEDTLQSSRAAVGGGVLL